MSRYNIFLLNGNSSILNYIQFLVPYYFQLILSYSSGLLLQSSLFCIFPLWEQLFHHLYRAFSSITLKKMVDLFIQPPSLSHDFKLDFISNFIQFSSVAQLCLTLCDPMNCSTPGLPVHYQLLESTQTHAHRVSDAIQPSHPLSSPSPPASNPSQHQGLFQRVNSSHEVAKVLEFQLQHQSFQ